ncbi:AAA family ATPase [Methylocystis sp. JAN1]|uniref:AAA family ATPase n=1 Tax=Methylocystis sp. JAN1 TaxID=3397211 RepID=UPI003FA1F313
MRTIAFVTQKGGAGKSTLASSVAVAARAAGERVFIIDLDPLQTLVKWADAREASDIGVEQVPPPKLPKAIAALEKKGVTLVVIDAPGQEGEPAAAAMRVADLCVIPARPNAFDLWASEKTRAQVKEVGCDYAFLLNQCPPAQQSARVELGAKSLQAMGGLLAPLVSARVDYQEAARLGLGVSEYNADGVAAQEMKELWGSIKRRLKRAPAKVAPARSSAEKAPAPAPKAPVQKSVAAPEPKSAAKKPARKAA